MAIDPVVLLAKDIRTTETALQAECKANSIIYSAARAETINMMLARIRALYLQLLETVPVSAAGASELTKMVAERLPFSHARYACHLNTIAGRLGADQRLHTDLVWLRALADALTASKPDERNEKTATMLALAIRGAAQPVIICRTATPCQGRAPNLDELSNAHFWPPPVASAGPASFPDHY